MGQAQSSTVASTIILLVLFFGGGFVGEQLALALAPGSGVSRLLGFLVLPASLMIGFFLWAGAAVLVLVKRLARGEARSGQSPRETPPGANGFLWSSVASCLVVGALTGLLSNEHGFLSATGTYLVAGLVYGTSCWRLAKSGWLPFPRE